MRELGLFILEQGCLQGEEAAALQHLQGGHPEDGVGPHTVEHGLEQETTGIS